MFLRKLLLNPPQITNPCEAGVGTGIYHRGMELKRPPCLLVFMHVSQALAEFQMRNNCSGSVRSLRASPAPPAAETCRALGCHFAASQTSPAVPCCQPVQEQGANPGSGSGGVSPQESCEKSSRSPGAFRCAAASSA